MDKKIIFFMILISSLLPAFVFSEEIKKPEDWVAKDFLPHIKRYNETLISGYANSNADLMKKVTSDKDVEHIQKLIQGLKEHNVRMLAKMKSLRIIKMERPDVTSAVIFTEEEWNYTYNDISTGAVKDKKDNITYNMAYIFMIEDGRWRIKQALYREEYEKMKVNSRDNPHIF